MIQRVFPQYMFTGDNRATENHPGHLSNRRRVSGRAVGRKGASWRKIVPCSRALGLRVLMCTIGSSGPACFNAYGIVESPFRDVTMGLVDDVVSQEFKEFGMEMGFKHGDGGSEDSGEKGSEKEEVVRGLKG
jgi:hypothetical protein